MGEILGLKSYFHQLVAVMKRAWARFHLQGKGLIAFRLSHRVGEIVEHLLGTNGTTWGQCTSIDKSPDVRIGGGVHVDREG